MEINFCRRCGAPLAKLDEDAYKCTNGHTVFYSTVPAAGLWLLNDNDEVLLVVRSKDPGKDKLCSPGGYCNHDETLEAALAREIREELGLEPSAYTTPQYFCSAVDDYPWEGNATRVLGCAFWARIVGQPVIKPGDDAGDYVFMKPVDIPREKLAFASHSRFLDALIDLQKIAA